MIRELIETFSKPTPSNLILRELVEAERYLLMYQSAKEYADSQVTYNTKRIVRLRNLAEQPTEQQNGNITQ